MKNYKLLILIFYVIFFNTLTNLKAIDNNYSPKYSSVVIDIKTNRILHNCRKDQQTQPASLTKLMTLFILFEKLQSGKLSFNSSIKFSANACRQKPSILGIKLNECITVKTAILALIVKSANDVAVAVAEKISGTEQEFVKLMNKRAKSLKMNSTIFKNASGWKDKTQLTTAADIAKLVKALICKFPQYYCMFSTKSFKYKNKKIVNRNKTIGCYSDIKIDGLKTGYVYASGYNLASSALYKGQRIIAVILGAKTPQLRNKRMLFLIKESFNKKNTKTKQVKYKISNLLQIINKKIT